MEISLFQRQSGRLFDFLYFAKSHGAMRCAYCTLPVSSIRWGALLIAMPRQSNKRGDLRPECSARADGWLRHQADHQD